MAGDPDTSSATPSLVNYPCDYEYKVIGRSAPDFPSLVRSLVEEALNTRLRDDQVQVLPSSHGRFESVRVTVRLEREEERVAVYVALSKQPRIVFYL